MTSAQQSSKLNTILDAYNESKDKVQSIEGQIRLELSFECQPLIEKLIGLQTICGKIGHHVSFARPHAVLGTGHCYYCGKKTPIESETQERAEEDK